VPPLPLLDPFPPLDVLAPEEPPLDEPVPLDAPPPLELLEPIPPEDEQSGQLSVALEPHAATKSEKPPMTFQRKPVHLLRGTRIGSRGVANRLMTQNPDDSRTSRREAGEASSMSRIAGLEPS
jgi:hypothetical protein